MIEQLQTTLGNIYLNHPGDRLAQYQVNQIKNWIDNEYSYLVDVIGVTIEETAIAEEPNLLEITERFLAAHMIVFTGGTESSVLGHEYNIKFRAIHDYHHVNAQADFSYFGECKAFEYARSQVSDRHSIITQFLFSEIVLQAAAFTVLNDFPESQKIVLLD